MSNTTAANAKKTPKMVGKIAVNTFRGERILGQPASVTSFECGTLLGIATGLIEKAGPTGEVFQGYEGNFEFVDADANTQGTRSGVLYLPGGINEMLLASVKAADGGQVQFALKVMSDRSTNAAGRSWSFEDLAPAATVDPMAELRKYLPGADTPAIEGPKPDAGKAGAPAK